MNAVLSPGNAAAPVHMKREHITPTLRPLYWRPVGYETDFKVLLRTIFLKRLMHIRPSRALRSAGAGQLIVPGVKTKQGEVAFSHYAAHRSRYQI